jgi:predicted  nucleic acid-binding Zn-ribbon protein
MSDQKDLLKRQLSFLAKSKKESEKAIGIFQGEMKRFKRGPRFESAKTAFAAVKPRLESIEGLISRVQAELQQARFLKQKNLPESQASFKGKTKKPKNSLGEN